MLPSYEDFTTPRTAPSPSLNATRGKRSSSFGTRLDRVKAHSRKLSNSLTKPLSPQWPLGGYHAVGGSEVREDSKYEMRALIDPNSVTRTASPVLASGGKSSGESHSFSDWEDRDSGKEFRVKF